MQVKIEKSWADLLSPEFESDYFQELSQKVKSEYQNSTVFPPGSLVFNAFNACSVDNCKVVIIGQDPYHGDNQANGLSFSVSKSVAIPPSLVNIYKEISKDLGFDMPIHGDLTPWANQGVLLLNASLTVRKAEAASHKSLGWQKFTNQVIKRLSDEKEHLVFLLWGGFAKGKIKFIDQSKHLILESGHPSPLSANRGYWFGNKHFSKTNTYLIQQKKQPIDWQIV
ncbi:MAG: uracil-DNA glycosylase [Flavobacteriales bacterium]